MHAFDVLGDPVRRRILELLADGEQASGRLTAAIQEEFGISQPAVSQHLRVLRESGFATVRADGTRRLYAVDGAALREVDAWLERFRGFWSQRLDALGTEIASASAGGAAPQTARKAEVRMAKTQPSDIADQINAVHREVAGGQAPDGEHHTVVLRRTYDAAIEDVWDACTNPERIGRWFLPVTGDLRPGGRYQLEGNAGGQILRCEPPRLLKVTWIFGKPESEAGFSEVEVRLSAAAGGQTQFELHHEALADPEMWGKFGPGAVGVGWDLALLGLALHLRGETVRDPAAWMASAQAKELVTASSRAWGAAHEASGASAAEAAEAAENTTTFYAPPH